jgi:hypothetical protein
MLDIGFAELLIFFVPMWALAALVVYWIIRLAVRHGTLDAYRIDRTDRRIAEMQAATRHRDGVSGDDRA